MSRTGLFADWIQLTKPRILQLNLFAAFGGYWLASKWMVEWSLLVWTLLGTALTMAASCVFNNIWDYKLDQKMNRTKERPLATGRLKTRDVVIYALTLGIAGEAILFWKVNVLCGWLGLIGMFVYIVIYTMWLKRTSTWSTSIGGMSGAIPPVIGYCAYTNEVDTGALLLFSLLFLWQPAHFWSLAIRRVEEYRAAGFPLLPVLKGIGRTKLQMIPYVALLFPTVILLYMYDYTGAVFLIVSLLASIVWLWHTLRGRTTMDTERWAKTNFLISVNYLMVVFFLMILDTPGRPF
ncbi:heme o synthase [Paenibacillus alginolyticus]|uniref:Protoheme IX farnesyltransferase n=1 Tax=Paenibacillus alginolyticus TaxID=59839 RepID=A0ABT4GHC2_9BACL|nr:heme o synthase [Paenibacillus alginolyticus]MCY9670295.1 heme o synthase [Paenibacillus alginolyticus]MCY9695596.1 heme o synthase [Paenibacillus alginolyticus]MEC0148252.1 heme o synthase [Paenibacillus alginolyticus]